MQITDNSGLFHGFQKPSLPNDRSLLDFFDSQEGFLASSLNVINTSNQRNIEGFISYSIL